jgi:hypothetical protein
VYRIEVPEGTKVDRETLTGVTVLVVPWEGQRVPIFDRPSKLAVQFAEAGIYGLRLLGEEPSGIDR